MNIWYITYKTSLWLIRRLWGGGKVVAEPQPFFLPSSAFWCLGLGGGGFCLDPRRGGPLIGVGVPRGALRSVLQKHSIKTKQTRANAKQTLLGIEFVGSTSHGRNPKNCKQHRKTNKKQKMPKIQDIAGWCFLHFLIFFAGGEDFSRKGPLHQHVLKHQKNNKKTKKTHRICMVRDRMGLPLGWGRGL